MLWLSEALSLLRLGSPAIYGLAVYFFFHYLDKRASGQAKKAIATWYRSPVYESTAVSNALVEVFDKLYTSPLLYWRAFLRSATISIVITTAFYAHRQIGIFTAAKYMPSFLVEEYVWAFLAPAMVANVISDYLSLFVIRRCMVIGGQYPLLTLVLGSVIGIAVVLALFLARDFAVELVTLYPAFGQFIIWAIFNKPIALVGLLELRFQYYLAPGSNLKFGLPALAVHLWLAGFAIGLLLVRLLGPLLWMTRSMQWFMKRGNEHPLDAVGYVLGVLTFIGTAIMQAIR